MKGIVIGGIHLSYWVVYFFIMSCILSLCMLLFNGDLRFVDFFKVEFRFLGITPSILGFYIFYYYIFRFLQKKQYKKTVIIGLIVTFSVGVLISVINLFISKSYNHFSTIRYKIDYYIIIALIAALLSLLNGILGLFLKGFFDWFDLKKEKEKLTKKNHFIELELVKSQLNPHFLFNSLNNINVLIYKNQDKASDYLNKLSEIIRFMLFESKQEQVPFSTEIEFIEKYIDLQKLRSKSENYVLINKVIYDDSILISSLIFIPFIENAFKYSSQMKEDETILVDFIQSKNDIRFICKNKFTKNKNDAIESNGLGNELLKKRLDLIFRNRYNLNISKDEVYFTVDLTIPYEAI